MCECELPKMAPEDKGSQSTSIHRVLPRSLQRQHSLLIVLSMSNAYIISFNAYNFSVRYVLLLLFYGKRNRLIEVILQGHITS